VKEKIVKSVLNRKKKRDDWFLDDYTLNPYEGCSFNCQYCYIRGSKYGTNIDETLAVKINSLEILEKQLALRAKKNQHGIIALASATDPYLKVEENYRLTRGFLELILKYRFPVLIITKSSLVLRDIDLLKEIDRHAVHAPDLASRLNAGAIVSFSFSTLDESTSSTLEPGAPPPLVRLETMRRCSEEGLLTGANLIPVLPFINDSTDQLDRIISTFKNFGARYVLAGGLTLFGDNAADSKTLYYHFLQRRFPELLPAYDKLFRHSFYPPHKYNSELSEKVRSLCDKHGIRNSIMALQ
jgi:DNA repair photolyase